MIRLFNLKLFFVFFLVLLPCSGSISAKETPKTSIIGITQIVEHPALNDVRFGLLESLKNHGFVPERNLTVHYENAQGNLVTSTQIATKLLSFPLDIIVAISTPSAQTVLYAAKRGHLKVPIVFTAVSDPVAAKLEPGETNYPITGITDTPNVEALLIVMQQMLPRFKTIGLLYNPSESNSVATITHFKKLLTSQSIAIKEVTVTSTANVGQAMQNLVGTVDAIYFPQDNTVVSAIETVAKYTHLLPVFCSDPLLVKRGVLAAVGYDYREVGKEAGEVVAQLLKGKSLAEFPVHHPLEIKTVVNVPLALKFKFSLPKNYSPPY